jgi:trimeric autotransporter adhesin
MANEFIIKKGLISKADSIVSGSLIVTEGISGSFSGSFQGEGSGLTGLVSSSFSTTSSYALTSLSSSYAPIPPTFPFTGDASITGSLTISGSGISFIASGGTVFSIAETGSFTLGEGATNSNDTNVAIGKSSNTAGSQNTAVGNSTTATGGNYNVAIGSGAQNTSDFGISIGGFSISRSKTIAIGHSSIGNIGTVAIGYNAGHSTGEGNVLIGQEAGNLTSGNGNIIIGSGSLGGAINNQLRIGNGESVTVISASLATGEILLNTTTISGSLLNQGTVSIDDTDSPYTITGTQQFILIDPSGGDVTVNLPDASTYPGRQIFFKLTQAAGANTVTLQRQGSDTIDGATEYTNELDIQYESISTVSNGGTGWFIF